MPNDLKGKPFPTQRGRKCKSTLPGVIVIVWETGATEVFDCRDIDFKRTGGKLELTAHVVATGLNTLYTV